MDDKPSNQPFRQPEPISPTPPLEPNNVSQGEPLVEDQITEEEHEPPTDRSSYVAPEAATTPQPFATEYETAPPIEPNKKSKKGLLIGLVVVGLLLLLGAGVAAYQFWYQNP